MFLRCCLWSLNSQLWDILVADGSNGLIFYSFCCLYKTEEDVVFTEGSTSLAVMSSVAGWTWGEAGSEHRQPQDWGKTGNFISSSLPSFCLLLCTSIPALLVILLKIKPQWKTPKQCCCVCCIPDVMEEVTGTTDKAVVSELTSSWKLVPFLQIEVCSRWRRGELMKAI